MLPFRCVVMIFGGVTKITKKKTLARPLPSAAEASLTKVDVDDVDDDDRMDDNDAKDNSDKDEDEDVELVDEEDPFFVVTITPTYNLMLGGATAELHVARAT
ncbi:hypothetical protein Tco_1397008 [Tanacetum coccineum]